MGGFCLVIYFPTAIQLAYITVDVVTPTCVVVSAIWHVRITLESLPAVATPLNATLKFIGKLTYFTVLAASVRIIPPWF